MKTSRDTVSWSVEKTADSPELNAWTSHAELRAALILAGKRIVKLNFGKKDDPTLVVLRRVLREARSVRLSLTPSKQDNAAEPCGSL